MCQDHPAKLLRKTYEPFLFSDRPSLTTPWHMRGSSASRAETWSDAVGPPFPEPRHVSYDAPPSPTVRDLLSDLSVPAHETGRILGSLLLTSASNRICPRAAVLDFPLSSMPGVWPESKLSSSALLSSQLVCFPAVVPSERSLQSFPSIILRLNASADPPLDLTLCLCTNAHPFYHPSPGRSRGCEKHVDFQNRHR